MFKRGKPQQFEITEHPEVIAALNAMWQQAYDAGRRDQVAIAKDMRDELRAGDNEYAEAYFNGMADVIERLES